VPLLNPSKTEALDTGTRQHVQRCICCSTCFSIRWHQCFPLEFHSCTWGHNWSTFWQSRYITIVPHRSAYRQRYCQYFVGLDRRLSTGLLQRPTAATLPMRRTVVHPIHDLNRCIGYQSSNALCTNSLLIWRTKSDYTSSHTTCSNTSIIIDLLALFVLQSLRRLPLHQWKLLPLLLLPASPANCMEQSAICR